MAQRNRDKNNQPKLLNFNIVYMLGARKILQKQRIKIAKKYSEYLKLTKYIVVQVITSQKFEIFLQLNL